MDGMPGIGLEFGSNTHKGNRRDGWSTRAIAALLLVASYSPAALAADTLPDKDTLIKIAVALGTILIAQAVIPVVKSWLTTRKRRKTYRNYLKAHVANTLDSYGGAGSTHFAYNFVANPETEWFAYLKNHDLGIPSVFLDMGAALDKAATNPSYIPDR